MSIPSIPNSSDPNSNLRAYSDDDLDLDDADLEELPTSKKTSDVSQGCLFSVNHEKQEIHYISPKILTAANQEQLETFPELKNIIKQGKKQLGAAKVGEKTIGSKNKELAKLYAAGYKPIMFDLNEDKKITKKTLSNRNIKHYAISTEEHDRILDIGLTAINHLSQHIAQREQQNKTLKEKGTSFFQNTNASHLKDQKSRTYLPTEILNSQLKEDEIKEGHFRTERLETEKIKDERSTKKVGTKRKNDHLDNMEGGQIAQIEKRQAIAKEQKQPPNTPHPSPPPRKMKRRKGP